MNSQVYKDFIDYFYGDINVDKTVYEVTKSDVIWKLKTDGISKITANYLYRRKFDRTNDYMLDAADAMQSYSKRKKPDYKHMCAVLLEGSY